MNIQNYFNKIASMSLFNTFKKEELMTLFESSNYRLIEHQKGKVIHIQNEICSTLDVILDGKVTVDKIDEEGNILLIDSLTDTNIIGASLLYAKNNRYPVTVISESRSIIVHLNQNFVLELCQKNNHFLVELISIISDKALFLSNKIDTLSFKTVRKSIIDFLKYEYLIQNSTTIQLRITKKELAERLGVQRTSLSRELNKMRKDSLLEFDRKSITIVNLELVI